MQKETVSTRQNLDEIGELLVELLTADISEVQRQMGWVIFERKLRQYYFKRRKNRFAIEKLAGHPVRFLEVSSIGSIFTNHFPVK